MRAELYKKAESDLEKEFHDVVLKRVVEDDAFVDDRGCQLKMYYSHYLFYKNKADSIPLNSLENVYIHIICNDHIKAIFLHLHEMELLHDFLKVL